MSWILWAALAIAPGPHALTLQFFFGEDGLIAALRSDARGRTVGSDAATLPPESPLPCWRGTITALRCEFVP